MEPPVRGRSCLANSVLLPNQETVERLLGLTLRMLISGRQLITFITTLWLKLKPERLVSSRAWTLSREKCLTPTLKWKLWTCEIWDIPVRGRHRPWLGLLGSLACSWQDFAHILERLRLPRDEEAETRSSRDPSYSELLLPCGALMWALKTVSVTNVFS